MSFDFEQALSRKCEQNPDLSVLQAQWAYDRRLIADALQAVSRTFPHYSRHDASHSIAILMQLTRVLGQARVNDLSATDLWLLLEAAYQHDIGMVLSDAQAREWLRSTDFRGHLLRLRHAEDRELAQAAELIDTANLDTGARTWPLDVRRALELVLADFGRQKHPQQAERVVLDPVKTIGLLSPRTPLIPDRLFRVLGAICAHHGRSFEETMTLPARETGVGTDDAHPRFVACMLRLGDLLDLDNGRFCPVMMTSFGLLPSSSMAHVEKHAAIRHLDIGPDVIRVEAECATYEAYEVTDQWLAWLRDELKNQMARWVDIMPNSRFGALPSAGAIGARLRDHLMLEPGRRPRFEVDREAILSLVKGMNLYDEPFSAMRELLQNAVDATLVRLWREKWSRLRRPEMDKLDPLDLRKALERWPIDVRIRRSAKKDSDKIVWRVTVRDRGTGISFDEIRYLQRIGGSSKNERRRRDISEMPEWLRPSGIFGIGLQSVFMFTNEVTITTKHHEKGEALKIILRNGGEPGSDGLRIKRLSNEEVRRFHVGTRVDFDLEVERIPKWWSVSYDPDKEASRALREFDFLAHDELPLDALKLRDAAQEFTTSCLATVRTYPPAPKSSEGAAGSSIEWAPFFDRDTHILIRSLQATLSYGHLDLSYRGAPVKNPKVTPWNMIIDCDVYSGRAKDVLQLNRDTLTRQGRIEFQERLAKALSKVFPIYIRQLRSVPLESRNDAHARELRAASWHARVRRLDQPVVGDEWLALSVSCADPAKSVTVRDIVQQDIVSFEIVIEYDDADAEMLRHRDRHEDYVVSMDPCTIRLVSSSSWLVRTLDVSHEQSYATIESRGSVKLRVLRFYRRGYTGAKEAIPLTAILPSQPRHVWRRATMPCGAQYAKLSYARVADPAQSSHIEDGIWPRMVCPFTVQNDGRVTLTHLSEYVKWTAKNADGGPTDEREVARTLWAFLQDADAAMAELWKDKKAYSLPIAEHELARWLT